MCPDPPFVAAKFNVVEHIKINVYMFEGIKARTMEDIKTRTMEDIHLGYRATQEYMMFKVRNLEHLVLLPLQHIRTVIHLM
jgi:hypothetical protein